MAVGTLLAEMHVPKKESRSGVRSELASFGLKIRAPGCNSKQNLVVSTGSDCGCPRLSIGIFSCFCLHHLWVLVSIPPKPYIFGVSMFSPPVHAIK